MAQDTQQKVATKLFIGFEMTTEIAILLSQSPDWKQASLDQKNAKLHECPYHGKKYLGQFLQYEIIALPQLKKKAEEIRQLLENFIPEFDAYLPEIHIFPIILIA